MGSVEYVAESDIEKKNLWMSPSVSSRPPSLFVKHLIITMAKTLPLYGLQEEFSEIDGIECLIPLLSPMHEKEQHLMSG
jgi:hypothetical protein